MRDEFISCSDDGLVNSKSLFLNGLEIFYFILVQFRTHFRALKLWIWKQFNTSFG